MNNILVARIDDRLIHGQVVTSWIKTYPITTIVIIDDDLSKNMLMQRIYAAAAPSQVKVEIWSEAESVDKLEKIMQGNEKLMLLVKTPEVFEKLIDAGIEIKKIILGGIGAKPGRTKLIRNVAVSESEKNSLKNMISKGVSIVYQLVPVDREIDLNSILEV